MTETVEVEGTGFTTASKTVEEVYRDMYGDDNVFVTSRRGSRIIRSKSAADEIKVEPRGDTVGLIVTETQPDTLGKIGNRLDIERDSIRHNTPENDDFEPTDAHIEEGEQRSSPGVPEVGDTFPNGSIVHMPPFTKEEAGYKTSTDQDFDPSHGRCQSCSHYPTDGVCLVVQGGVEPNDYCEEFFADVGVFGHQHDDFVEENLILWGEAFNWSMRSVKEFVNDVEERLNERVRGE